MAAANCPPSEGRPPPSSRTKLHKLWEGLGYLYPLCATLPESWRKSSSPGHSGKFPDKFEDIPRPARHWPLHRPEAICSPSPSTIPPPFWTVNVHPRPPPASSASLKIPKEKKTKRPPLGNSRRRNWVQNSKLNTKNSKLSCVLISTSSLMELGAPEPAPRASSAMPPFAPVAKAMRLPSRKAARKNWPNLGQNGKLLPPAHFHRFRLLRRGWVNSSSAQRPRERS